MGNEKKKRKKKKPISSFLSFFCNVCVCVTVASIVSFPERDVEGDAVKCVCSEREEPFRTNVIVTSGI